MNSDEDARAKILYLRRCWVCGNPYESVKAESRCCRRPLCRWIVSDIDGIMVLQFIVTNTRWGGGEGLETMEEMMRLAVESDIV